MVPAAPGGNSALTRGPAGARWAPAAPGDLPREPLPFGLTQAELVVLQAAAQGLTVPETARQLHKGAETVKTQRNKIILKIGARNMTHAVCIATESSLVSSAADGVAA